MLIGREWFKAEPASQDAIEALKRIAPAALPSGYFELLSFSNGGEGPLPVDPFNLCLDPVQEVIDRIQSGNYGQADFDGFVIFGSNGGGEYLAFDTRGRQPWPIVSLDMIGGSESAVTVSPDFAEFFSLIGEK